jgi:hypothetical protein
MGGFDAKKAAAVFHVPMDYTCLAMMAIGYQTSPDTLSPELQKGELAARSRVPIEEHFFNGTWGIGI